MICFRDISNKKIKIKKNKTPAENKNNNVIL